MAVDGGWCSLHIQLLVRPSKVFQEAFLLIFLYSFNIWQITVGVIKDLLVL